MSSGCPLCGDEVRFILTQDEFIAYRNTNPKWDVCLITEKDAERARYAVHTRPDLEWQTPPDYVLDRSIEDFVEVRYPRGGSR